MHIGLTQALPCQPSGSVILCVCTLPPLFASFQRTLVRSLPARTQSEPQPPGPRLAPSSIRDTLRPVGPSLSVSKLAPSSSTLTETSAEASAQGGGGGGEERACACACVSACVYMCVYGRENERGEGGTAACLSWPQQVDVLQKAPRAALRRLRSVQICQQVVGANQKDRLI